MSELPAHDLDAEAAVLSACFLDFDGKTLSTVRNLIKHPDYFYSGANSTIFSVICTLDDQGKPCDTVTVASALRDINKLRQVGGSAYIAELTDKTPSVPNVAEHAKIVAELAQQRKTIAALRKCVASGSGRIENVVKWRQEVAESILSCIQDSDTEYEPGDAASIVENIRAFADAPNSHLVSTGYPTLDSYYYGGLSRKKEVVIGAVPGNGKCLGRNTPVLMFNGTIKPVQDVVTGDLLVGPDSKPRKVLSTTHGTGPLYNIIPNKGDPWVCNNKHVLTLVYSGKRNEKVYDIEIEDFMTSNKSNQVRSKLFHVGIEYPEKDLLVDPYLVGMWLGDGNTSLKTLRITKNPEDVLSTLEEYVRLYDLKLTSYGKSNTECRTWTLRRKENSGPNHLLNKFRALMPDGKRIPLDYLTASREQRLELLAGILDTDGSINHNCFDIVQKSFALTTDICQLSRSLGFSVSGIVKNIVNNTTYYRIGICGPIDKIPNRIKRKICNKKTPNKSHLRTGFKIENLGNGEYYGFELDCDGRFLLGDFTVTHNSALAANIAINVADTGRGAVFVTLEMTKEELLQRMVSHYTQIPFEDIILKKFNRDRQLKEKYNAALEHISTLPLAIVEGNGPTAAEIRTMVRREHLNLETRLGRPIDLSLVVVDYLQLMNYDVKNDIGAKALGDANKELLWFAREGNFALLGLSQLNKSVESRITAGKPDRRPRASDLRYSGDIEADAYSIIMPYREDKYRAEHEDPDGIAELLIRKNRNGRTGTAKMHFEGPCMSFRELA